MSLNPKTVLFPKDTYRRNAKRHNSAAVSNQITMVCHSFDTSVRSRMELDLQPHEWSNPTLRPYFGLVPPWRHEVPFFDLKVDLDEKCRGTAP